MTDSNTRRHSRSMWDVNPVCEEYDADEVHGETTDDGEYYCVCGWARSQHGQQDTATRIGDVVALQDLRDLIHLASDAINGDSNDAEHDALVSIRGIVDEWVVRIIDSIHRNTQRTSHDTSDREVPVTANREIEKS